MFRLKCRLQINKVYLYYQQPCLLSYKDNINIYYLAVWIEDPDLYLVSRVDYKDLLELENDKELKCRHLFINSKYSFLHRMNSTTIKRIYEIPEDYLPL